MSDSPVLEFWYEFASTYSYPAAMRAAEAAARAGVGLRWRPFLLGPIFTSLGWETSPFNLQPAKGRYMWRDMERICTALDLRFQRPSFFPQNGLQAARIALALPDGAARGAFTRAVYSAQFGEGADISDPSVLMGLLHGMDEAPGQVIERAQSDEIKGALREATAAAQSHGIFGAPTWRTADGEIFWGNDRLKEALSWAATPPSGAAG